MNTKRGPILREEFEDACRKLEEGENPVPLAVRALRAVLGGGSHTTINQMLGERKELKRKMAWADKAGGLSCGLLEKLRAEFGAAFEAGQRQISEEADAARKDAGEAWATVEELEDQLDQVAVQRREENEVKDQRIRELEHALVAAAEREKSLREARDVLSRERDEALAGTTALRLAFDRSDDAARRAEARESDREKEVEFLRGELGRTRQEGAAALSTVTHLRAECSALREQVSAERARGDTLQAVVERRLEAPAKARRKANGGGGEEDSRGLGKPSQLPGAEGGPEREGEEEARASGKWRPV